MISPSVALVSAPKTKPLLYIQPTIVVPVEVAFGKFEGFFDANSLFLIDVNTIIAID